MTADDPGGAMCPRTRGLAGRTLLGVVGPDGRVGYLTPEVRIDAEFVRIARRGGASPEKRFRFAGPCRTSACSHWTEHGCGVITAALRHEGLLDRRDDTDELPPCAIRSRCRWHAQEGAAACSVCPHIVHDAR